VLITEVVDADLYSVSILTWVSQYNNVSIWSLLKLRAIEVVVTAGAITHAKLWSVCLRRVDFKLATFMYKMLHGQIPRYLSGDCQLISDTSRRLRSSDTVTFAVPRTRTRLSDRSFAVAGPQIWNSLPTDLHLVDNYARFRRFLKGHMFG